MVRHDGEMGVAAARSGTEGGVLFLAKSKNKYVNCLGSLYFP
jgi:hypothetical protein